MAARDEMEAHPAGKIGVTVFMKSLITIIVASLFFTACSDSSTVNKPAEEKASFNTPSAAEIQDQGEIP